MVTEIVPQLLSTRQRAELILGLRARVSRNLKLVFFKTLINNSVSIFNRDKMPWLQQLVDSDVCKYHRTIRTAPISIGLYHNCITFYFEQLQCEKALFCLQSHRWIVYNILKLNCCILTGNSGFETHTRTLFHVVCASLWTENVQFSVDVILMTNIAIAKGWITFKCGGWF